MRMMLMGRPPFEASTIWKLRNKHLYAPVPTIAVHGDSMPDELNELLFRCLAKQKNRRFTTVDELLEKLCQF